MKYLYHGTHSGALPSIRAAGLRPRATRRGNWSHSVESNSRAVYLTDAYPLYFATHAASDRKDRKPMILEIAVDALNQSRLAPDEDFLEQGSRTLIEVGPRGVDMAERTRWFRRRALSDFSHLWRDSIAHLGTCAYYGTIPPEAITRWAIIPPRHKIIFMCDPIISLMNYKILGEYYRALTGRIFGHEFDASLLEHRLASDSASRLAAIDCSDIEIVINPASIRCASCAS